MAGHPRVTPLWRNLSFTLMWTSVAASGFGDRIIMLASLVLLGGFAVGDETSAARVSVNAAINFWFFLPYVLLCVPGGWLADRLPRKWLLLGCDEARAVLLLVAFFAIGDMTGATVPEDHRWKILAILFGVGSFAAIFSPTKNALVPQVIPVQQLQPANAILLSIATIASMIGMIVGGEIIDPQDGRTVRNGLLVCLALYAVSGLFFAFMRVEERGTLQPADPATPASLAPSTQRSAGPRTLPAHHRRPSATRYILHHRRVMILIGLTILVWAAAMIVFQATVSLTRLQYGLELGEQLRRWTWLSAALGVGMIGGAGVVAAIRTRRESDLVIFTAITGAGVCTLLLAVTPVFWLGMAFAFGVGVFGNVVIITVTSLLQSIAPDLIRGRVMGVTGMLNTISNVLINLAIWKMPDADRTILLVTAVMGPVLGVIGVGGLWYALTHGPHDLKMANLFWRVVRFYVLTWHRLRVVGKHRVPGTGPVILASNHTTGLDPLLIQGASMRAIRWLMLASYRFKLLEPLWQAIKPITLDRSGRDLGKIRKVVETLQAGEIVGLYPEGSLQRDQRELQPFHPGIGMIAKRAGGQVVPVWISGTPQQRNMLWHFLQPSHSTVTFGEAYTPNPDSSAEEITQDLRRRMLELAAQVDSSHAV